MNIKVQCCGIVLILLLIIIYHTRRRIQLTTSRVFQACCFTTLACLVLDVGSIFGIVYQDQLPAFLPPFICKTYIAFLVMVSLLAVIYVATGVSFHLSYYKKIITAYTAFGIGVISLIYALPITIHLEADRNLAWTSGPSTIVTYVGVFVLIFLNLLQIYRHREFIYERQQETVLLWMYIWIGAAVIQGLFNEMLVVGFASALSMMLLFIQFENPELYLDRNTGLFNAIAYNRYVEQLYSTDEDFSVVGVTFGDTPWQNDLQPAHSIVESQRIYNAFLKIPGAHAFKIQENEILLVFPKTESAEYAWNVVTSQQHMPNIDALPSRPSIYYVPDPRCVNSPRELLELLRYVSEQKSSTMEGSFHVIDEDTTAQIFSDREIAQMIMDALAEDRVIVYYQPIYSVEQKRFTSAEALVRIVDREGNLIPPMAFIRTAENNGMILELGKRVFEKVCQFFQQNQLDKYGLDYVEVNLSVVQCVHDKLANDYISIMENAQMDPRRINLEITESASTHGKRTMIANMDQMINYGVGFSLDDFGTGASNLNYIVDMPVQVVKFDRGMIQAYFSSNKAKYVMDAAMHMIHGMGLKIVAEGVETEEQYRKMEEIKINYIQGYYFSKPLPEQELLSFLARENGVRMEA